MRKYIKIVIAIIFVFMVQLSQVMAYNNVSNNTIKGCGPSSSGTYLIKDIPSVIVKLVHIIYIIIQIVVPVLLVIFGMIDLIKAITAGKEDEIKKVQGTFIRRLISGALVFFIFVIVKLLVNFSGADRSTSRIVSCMNCFINEKCK